MVSSRSRPRYVARHASWAIRRIAGASEAVARRTRISRLGRGRAGGHRRRGRRGGRAPRRASSGRRCWRSVGASALRRAIAALISMTTRSRARPGRDGWARASGRPGRGSRPDARAAAGPPCRPRSTAARRRRCAASGRPSPTRRRRSRPPTAGARPGTGARRTRPSSIASRSWRSTRLSHVGATWRRPSASRRLAGRRSEGRPGAAPCPNDSGTGPSAARRGYERGMRRRSRSGARAAMVARERGRSGERGWQSPSRSWARRRGAA